MATYYIDTNDFTTATSIWTNSNLTVKAADGFYQKDGFYRQMSGGELLSSTICPSCLIPCGETIINSGAQGIYYLSVELGAATGAVIIEFDPDNVPDGILATYNSINYNGLSSPVWGWRQGTAGLVTYVGTTGSDCNIVANSPHTLNEFEYNGTVFAPTGTTTIVSVVSGQMQLTASAPGNCIMVIPKTLASPSDLLLTFVGPCTGTVFDVSVSCPAPLQSFDSSTMNATSELACSSTITTTYYVAHVNGAAGTLGLYDLVFSNANGQSKLSAGYYKTNDAGTNDWYQVDANGAIISFGICTVPCGGTIEGDGAQGVYYIESSVGTGTGAIVVKFNPSNVPDGILATYNGINYNGLSSPTYGWLQGVLGEATYIGATGDDCGIVGPTRTLAEFEYNGTTFVPLGTNINVTVALNQLQLRPLPPGNSVMVIPKTTALPSVLDIQLIGICGDTLFDIDITCPAALPSFASSTGNGDSASACSATISPTYYVAHVTGSGGVLGINDLVFSDPNGQFKLGSGYYKTTAAGSNNWYQVNFNGVIIAFGTCP
jgi:hypothetical protein